MAKHLVLVGGGHAHMTTMVNGDAFVRKGHRITLISASPFHYYSGMGPGMLGGTYRPEGIRFHVSKMIEDRGGAFVEGRVVKIDPQGRTLSLVSGDEITYDVVSFNTGSDVPLDEVLGVDETMFPVKPIVSLLQARQAVLKRIRTETPQVLVVGGGPAGLEITGNVWRLVKDQGGQAGITLLAGRTFLPCVPDKVRRLAAGSLSARGIEVVQGSRVKRFEGGRAVLEDGRSHPFDLVFLALGVRPSPLFRDSGLPVGDDGGLLVNSRLQSVGHPEIFGGGDCISLKDETLAKVGVYAVRQNPILYHNLMAALEGEELTSFDPGGVYLLVFNLGNGRGIYWRGSRVWDGRLAFRLKDYIDRKFMRKFQVSGER